MIADLLLLRLEVLKRGVKDVQEILEAGKAARTAIKEAQDNFDSAWWFADNILGVAENQKVINALEVLLNSPGGEFKNELRKISDGLKQVREAGKDLKCNLESAQGGLRRIDSRAVNFGRDFGKKMGDHIRNLSGQIDELVTELREEPASAELWKKYFRNIQPSATRLFMEYLDLLGGVSIRERGLAIKALVDVCYLDELCALADWHFANELTLCQDWDGPEFVALPGRDLANISAWPILRLGFASWSIWGLTLEGHEFGKLLADARLPDRSERLRHWKPYFTEFGDPGVHMLIADTVAAWAEGPAYACALLFLVLNPSRAQIGCAPGKVCDADRAAVVLATLRSRAMLGTGGSRRNAGGYDYLPFIGTLEKKWNDACDSAGAVFPPERLRVLKSLPDAVQTGFDLQKPFELRDWNLAGKVLAYINRDQGIPVDLTIGVRHLTNAAWRGRLRAADGSGQDPAGNDQASPEELEQRAMKAGIELIKTRDKKTPGGDTGSLKSPGH
jgi:hypothetical protein